LTYYATVDAGLKTITLYPNKPESLETGWKHMNPGDRKQELDTRIQEIHSTDGFGIYRYGFTLTEYLHGNQGEARKGDTAADSIASGAKSSVNSSCE